MDSNKATEEIQFIKSILNDTKIIVRNNGVGNILWGILVTVGLALTYFQIVYKFSSLIFDHWIWLIGIGWIVTIYNSISRRKRVKAYSFGGKLLSAVWFSSGIAMTILGFIGTATGAYPSVFISPLISVVLGVSYFITGFLIEYTWFKYLSIGWWAGAIYMFIYPSISVLLIMALMIFTLQIIPGIVMYFLSKKEQD